ESAERDEAPPGAWVLRPVDRQQDPLEDRFDVRIPPRSRIGAVLQALCCRVIAFTEHDLTLNSMNQPKVTPGAALFIIPPRRTFLEECGDAFARILRAHRAVQV